MQGKLEGETNVQGKLEMKICVGRQFQILQIRVFDSNGNLLSILPAKPGPQLKTGDNRITLNAVGAGNAVLTAITMDK